MAVTFSAWIAFERARYSPWWMFSIITRRMNASFEL